MKLAAVGLLLSMGPPLALANDGFGQLAAGGVVIGKTTDIAMAREVLDIGYDFIEVNYDFINESNQDISDTVIFPLPAYPANPAESGVIYSGQPDDFKVMANGEPVRFETTVQAFMGARDVTATLLEAGISKQQIATMPFDRSLLNEHQLIMLPAQIALLKNQGLLDDTTPRWTIHVRYEWQQLFPAGKTVHVYHRYRPFAALGTAGTYIPSTALGRKNLPRFCFDQSLVEKLDHLYQNRPDRDYGLPGTVVEYILQTANSWKDGIRDFTLKIHKRDKKELVSLCFPGTVHMVNAKTPEFDEKNFHPAQDIAIYFGNITPFEPASAGQTPVFSK